MTMHTRSNLDRGGNRWLWSNTRRMVMARDRNRCQGNGPRCTTIATEVDHITERAAGGDDSLSNLRALCHQCHITRSVWDRGYLVPSRYSYGSSRVVTRDYTKRRTDGGD